MLVRARSVKTRAFSCPATCGARSPHPKTEFGESLMANIEAQRPALEREKARKERERAEARAKSPYYGEDRVKFGGDHLRAALIETSRLGATVRRRGIRSSRSRERRRNRG